VIRLKLVTPFGLALRAVGLGLATLFHWAWLSQPLGWPLASFHLALVLLALARPRDAILVLAGLGPVSTTLSALLHSPRPGWSVLAAMLWAVATGLLVRPPHHAPLRLRRPAMLLAVVAIGSALVAIAGDPLYITGYTDPRGAAAALMSGEWFEWTWPWVPLHLAMLMTLALYIAVSIEPAVRVDHPFGMRLCSMLVIGHIAAVGVGLSRFAATALREVDAIAAWTRILWNVRYYSEYDVNAAGSILVIVACAGIGLVAVVRHRLPAMVGVLAAVVGVWMTGSRAALVALTAVLLVKPMLHVVRVDRRAWRRALVPAAVAALAGVTLYTFYPASRNVPTSVAYESRLIMLRTAWHAGLSHPVFGIGMGLLPRRGIEFGSADMQRLAGVQGTRENAHNQYLQLFAELGSLGVIALAWLIGSLGWRHSLMSRQVDPVLSWTTWGLIASLLTWMLGHPLLVPEAAVAFWLFVGLVAGLSPAPAALTRGWTAARGAGVVMLLFAVLSVPWRAGQAARAAGLEHQGLGVSETWEREGDVAYRLAGSRFSLFLPASAAIALPLRAAPSTDTAMVEIYLRDILIDRAEITADAWRRVTIRMPDSARAYERVDFVVAGKEASLADSVVIHVGRARPVGELVPAAR
jgi:hypothetical protein